MGELGELLELLDRADDSYLTLYGEFCVRRDWARAHQATLSELDERQRNLIAARAAASPPPAGESIGLVRLWIQRPDLMREERQGGPDGRSFRRAKGRHLVEV